MDKDWINCKNILCIRADNMGDLLMSTPAIAAVKKLSGCRITVLTSTMAAGIARLIPDIDQVIVADLPWMKLGEDPGPERLLELISSLKQHNFDGCVIFSVYSQNTLPAAMLAYMAGIPLRLAYCRENPYHLLSHWVPDPEPFTYIKHQVERDLELVKTIGADTREQALRLRLNPVSLETLDKKLALHGADLSKPYLVLHPGVSEEKRKYPEELWIMLGKMLVSDLGIPLLISGTAAEQEAALRIARGIGPAALSIAGLCSLEEFAWLISRAETLVSVNTGTTHLAAAVHKPLVVLYAQTNPQHSPWNVKHILLEYSVDEHIRSRNEVIRYVNDHYYGNRIPYPTAEMVLDAVKLILQPEK